MRSILLLIEGTETKNYEVVKKSRLIYLQDENTMFDTNCFQYMLCLKT